MKMHVQYLFFRVEPSKADLDVLRALEVCEVSPVTFPHIFSWQKHVLSYDEFQRNTLVFLSNFTTNTIVISASCVDEIYSI